MQDYFRGLATQQLSLEEDKKAKTADPLVLVPGRNYSSIKELTETYFGNQQLYTLRNFDLFVNLEVLWLNGNCLASLAGLQHNFRLKELYIFNNQLTELEPQVFRSLIFLHTLSAYNNNIDNLDRCLEVLEINTHLEKLDLFQNPLENEPFYRSKLFQRIRGLKMVDWMSFNEKDKKETQALQKAQIRATKSHRSQKPLKSIQNEPERLKGKHFSIIEKELYQKVVGRLGEEGVWAKLSKK